MIAFDPFTATLDEALAQYDANVMPRGALVRWGSAQDLNKRKEYYEQHPVEGVSHCVRDGLVAPDWLAVAFLRQYDKVLTCRVATWDEAFGPAQPIGNHLSTLRLKRWYGWQVLKLFTDDDFRGRKRLPRTPAGRDEAARILGITEKQVRALLPKTRSNVKGHKPYKLPASKPQGANDPFSIASRKVPKT